MFNSIKRVFSKEKDNRNELKREIEELKQIVQRIREKEGVKREAKPSTYRYIPEYIKVEVRKRQNNRCAICGKFFDDLINYDHKIPVALGGASDVNNVQALCPDCHQFKTRHDRFLISIMNGVKGIKRELILKNIGRGWFFVGDLPECAGGTPSWVINTIETAGFRFNKKDQVMFTVLKGTSFTYLVVQYGRGKFLVFRRLNKRMHKRNIRNTRFSKRSRKRRR